MVIADTGFWVALGNRKDDHHEIARTALEALDEGLVSTWPVMTETCHLLLGELGPRSQQLFMKSFHRGAFQVFPLTKEHAPRMVELMEKYQDLPMDLADASLVILAEALGHGRILSTDTRDFKTYRWKSRKPFQNLLAI